MSVEEDTELRDLVAQTLETNGVLNKIRAELRANVFLALEEQDSLQKKSVSNKQLKSYLETKEGHQVFSLVREFLQFFQLDFTLAVLDPESDYTGKASMREDLSHDLNLRGVSTNKPLLSEFIKVKVSTKSTQQLQQKSVDSQQLKNTSNNQDVLLSEELDDEDDLLKELGVSPLSYTNNNTKNKRNTKPSWLEPSPKTVKKTEDLSPISSLSPLKDAPPLPGVGGSRNKNKMESPLDVTSPEWDDLMKIDRKISDLGFEIPKDDSSSSQKEKKSATTKESEFNYEDDFNASSSQKSEGLSITEEIEDDISIGSFAESNKGDDLVTTDLTVSQISGNGFDYTEDADAF